MPLMLYNVSEFKTVDGRTYLTVDLGDREDSPIFPESNCQLIPEDWWEEEWEVSKKIDPGLTFEFLTKINSTPTMLRCPS
jgi:hypothetical protein